MVRSNDLVLAMALSAMVCQAGAAQDLPDETLLRAAVLPLPTSMRADAGVLLESPSGEIRRVRASGNGFSCVLRDHSGRGSDVFDARCYSDQFWPAILRMWELSPRYDTFDELNEQLHREFQDGALSLPDAPTAGYRIRGPRSEVDFETGMIGSDVAKWQSIHFPFRTAEELGLTEQRESSREGSPGQMPFVMASGTWWSHVMIVHQ